MTEWNIRLEDSDKINSKLKRLLEDLKPYSCGDPDYSFFEVVRELLIATAVTYEHLRRGYVEMTIPFSPGMSQPS